MTEFSRTRRHLMFGTAAWVGGIAAMTAARPAGAAMQSVDLTPVSPLGAAVANRCPICGCPVIVSR